MTRVTPVRHETAVDSSHNGTHGTRMTRTKNLVVRLNEGEDGMIAALSAARDEPKTMVVRRLILAAFVERFGLNAPTKHAK